MTNKSNESIVYQSEWAEEMLMKSLKRVRKSAALTQSDVAESIHTSKSNISRLEVYRHSPTFNTLCNYIDALGLKFKVVVYE
jgi:DNA-binding XRE family transcriptional regulator